MRCRYSGSVFILPKFPRPLPASPEWAFACKGSLPCCPWAVGLFALQCLFGAAFHAFHAQNALRAVFAAAGIVGNVYLHGADLFAFAAGDAFAVVALYPEQGEITHGLEKNGNGADILAEPPYPFEKAEYVSQMEFGKPFLALFTSLRLSSLYESNSSKSNSFSTKIIPFF